MRNLLVILVLIFLSQTGFGQVRSVHFRINHLAKGAPLSYSLIYQNDLEQDYRFTRIEYFITGFELSSETGRMSLIDSVCLVNAAKPAQYDLGSIDLERVDSLHFHFGVDKERNHGDPSVYPLGHPLAPRDRYSMHWDWASGYRFWAVEGDADTTGDGEMDVSFQYHIAIDGNYLPASLETIVQNNDSISFLMDIDYVDLLAGVDFRGEPVVHGGFGGPYDTPLDSMLVRLRTRSCYSSGFQRVLNTNSDLDLQQTSMHPNPAHESLHIDHPYRIEHIQILDELGRMIKDVLPAPTHEVSIQLEGLKPGVYFVRITDEKECISTKRLIIR